MRQISLNLQIFIAAFLAILVGLYLNRLGADSFGQLRMVPLLKLMGGIFIDLLKMVMIPLIFSSVATGVASLGDHEQSGPIWRRTMTFYLSTTALAAAIGLVLINTFEPGRGLSMNLFQDVLNVAAQKDRLSLSEFLNNFLRGIFVNPVKAMAEGAVLPTVVYALLFGLALVERGGSALRIREMISELLELSLVMIGWIMQLAPLGVFALMAHLVATQELEFFTRLVQFVAVIMGALLLQGLVVLPGILFFMTGYSPVRFFSQSREALMTAFATCSSAATLAVAMRVATDRLGVSPSIARFIMPLGAVANSDGTALYEAGAALFIANLVGIDLNWMQQIMVCFMSVVAALGAPGLPSAGMVTMIMVLQSVGLPVEAIAILLPVDRLLDTFRTAVNVEGDLVGALVVEHLGRQDSVGKGQG